MPKLNDTQTILLAHAARHDVGSFFPLPETHARTDARVSKALTSLSTAGFAEEREPTDRAHIYHEEGDLRFGLYITAAGLSAIGIEQVTGADQATSHPGRAPEMPARATKAGNVLALLQRSEGATLDELIAATGWLPHTTRAALTGFRKKGHTFTKGKRGDKTCYTVAGA